MSVGSDLLNLVFGKEWTEKCQEIRDASPFGHLKGWRLASFIMKAGEDIRRESLVMQIIAKLQRWFDEEIPAEHRPYLRPYNIMCVGADAGIVECVTDAKSIDEIKKRTDHFVSLLDYFERAYGPPQSRRRQHQQTSSSSSLPPTLRSRHADPIPNQNLQQQQESYQHRSCSVSNNKINFETAQDNFLRSLVGYSLVCYILQIKDRHNANILMDRMGHILHIDYGTYFLYLSSPFHFQFQLQSRCLSNLFVIHRICIR
jgi:phosphatidylinositol kinase/protein kinase (PI-3  family)